MSIVSTIAADQVTLSIMTEVASLSDELIAAWQKENPNIKIIREDINGTKFIADYLAGTPADVFQVGAGADIPYYVKRGILFDISVYLKNNQYFKESEIDIGGNQVLSQILVEVAKSRRSCIIKQPNHRTVRLLFEERRFRPPFALF